MNYSDTLFISIFASKSGSEISKADEIMLPAVLLPIPGRLNHMSKPIGIGRLSKDNKLKR